ncbi:DUF4214 domain-containing protein [Massilia sp. DD77]|uniref:DUF4214 domain-containing protein n=1 Tax=Massilia sp. DD77 TaxID=3109349 RepID=UPI002FFEAE11
MPPTAQLLSTKPVGHDRMAASAGSVGRDTYVLPDRKGAALTIPDFQTGEGGDLLDLSAFISRWDDGDPNPFGPAGRLRVEQRGADTVLQARFTSAGGVSSYGDIAILAGIDKASLGAANVVLGFNPDGSQAGRKMTGTGAADRLEGGWLDDDISGGIGDDTLWGGAGDDYLSGGNGNDILSGDLMGEMPAGIATDETGDDILEGGTGDDQLSSSWGNDVLRGGGGNDLLWLHDGGNPAARVDHAALHGGSGDDVFRVRYGKDADPDVVLEGGAGKDTYDIQWLPVGRGSLTILDFDAGDGGDRIAVKAFPLPKAALGNPFASGYLRLVQRGADTVFEFDGDGAGTAKSFLPFMVLEGVNALGITADNIVEGFTPFVAGSTPPPPTPRPPTFPGQVRNGTPGADVMIGAAGDDRLDGGAGDDVLVGGAGNDSLIGGAGFDSARYNDIASGYTVTHGAAGGFVLSATDGAADNGSDILLGIERLHFADGALALDTDGIAGQAYRIYRAAFDRTPDPGGLGYWMASMDGGASLKAVARGFMSSKEFLDLYGSAPTNAAVVLRLYQNVLHRKPDPDGFAFWVKVLDEKRADLPHVLAQISESAENQDAVAELIANGIWFTPYEG